MEKKIEFSNKELSSIELDSLMKLKEKAERIKNNNEYNKENDDFKTFWLEESDFKILDKEKDNLSIMEELLYDKLSENGNIIEWLSNLINKLEDFNKININLNINNNTTIEEFNKEIENKIHKLSFEEAFQFTKFASEELNNYDELRANFIGKNEKWKPINFSREKIFNIYLNSINPKKAEKIIQENWKLLLENNMCPKNKTVLEIRNKILEAEKENFNKNVKLYYGKELWKEFKEFLEYEMNNSKEKLCSVNIIKFVKKFEKKSKVINYLKKENKEWLWDDTKRVKELVSWMLKIKKSEEKVKETEVFIKEKINQVEFKNSTEKEKKESLISMWLTEEQAENKIKEISEISNKIEKIESAQNFIKSLNHDEIETIINSEETPEDTRKKIEEDRLQEEFNNNSYNLREINNPEYKVEYASKEITDNNSIQVWWVIIDWITKEEFDKFWIEQDEKWSIINIENKEAIKNLVDMKQNLSALKLDFIWEQRHSIINIMNNKSEFASNYIDANDEDLIDKTDFNVLLKFILKVSWVTEPDDTLEQNYQKIRDKNNENAMWMEIDTHTWLSNIWLSFIKAWYLNSSWKPHIFWEDRLRVFVKNWYQNSEPKKLAKI